LTRFAELACSRRCSCTDTRVSAAQGRTSKRALAAGDPIKQGGSYLIQIKPETPNALIG
jgi:hypothetical protein